MTQIAPIGGRPLLSCPGGRAGETEGGLGAEELVRWAGIPVEDEDTFVIEGKFRGLPRDMGRIEGFGLRLLGPEE